MSTVRVRLMVLALALFSFGAATPAISSDERPVFEIGIEGGFVFLDEDLAGADGPTAEAAVGLRIGGPFFARRLSWFADALYSEIDTETFRMDAQRVTGRAGMELALGQERPNPWFVALGAGFTEIDFDAADKFTSAVASAGIGQWVWVGGETYLRWELRADHTLAESGLYVESGREGQDITDATFLVGLHWKLGKRERRDADGDGVRDRRDRCPDTPFDAQVDRRGCPVTPEAGEIPPAPEEPAAVAEPRGEPGPDTDADGVPDEIDRCPTTITGVEVDRNGCPLDADGDGVYDGLGMDRCPDTPAGAEVDSFGCPRDTDGDGVWDGLDRCPDTPEGATVGPDGCPPA